MNVTTRVVVIAVKIMEKYGNFSLLHLKDADAVTHNAVIHSVNATSGIDSVSEYIPALISASPLPILTAITASVAEIGRGRLVGFTIFAIGMSVIRGIRSDILFYG